MNESGRFGHARRIAAAAAVLVLGLVVCAAAAGIFGARIADSFAPQNEPGCDPDTAVEKVPIDDLTEEIRETGDIIRRQFAQYEPYDSWYPGSWETSFPTRDEACGYIGYDRLKRLDWEYEEQETALGVLGNKDGQILSVNVETSYAVDNMNVQFFSWIYTENYNEELTQENQTLENVEFEETLYTAEDNTKCHIRSSSVLESGYMWTDGYIVEEGVLYNLHIAYEEKDSAQAMELIHQWAELL